MTRVSTPHSHSETKAYGKSSTECPHHSAEKETGGWHMPVLPCFGSEIYSCFCLSAYAYWSELTMYHYLTAEGMGNTEDQMECSVSTNISITAV